MDVLFRPARHWFNRAKLEEHSHCIRWREEAVFVFFRGMQTDVEVFIPRGDYDFVRHEVAVPMRDFMMVAWTQNNHIAIWPGRHS